MDYRIVYLILASMAVTISSMAEVASKQANSTARISMDPPSPVNEKDQLNVTLTCHIEEGEPEAVRFYLDGYLLKELPDPDCPEGNLTASHPLYNFCDIDPSKIRLESVSRDFEGLYKCQAKTAAGWGEISTDKKLSVYYPPSPARVDFEPLLVVKGEILRLHCFVDDFGNPPLVEYNWTRDGQVQKDQIHSNWNINPVSIKEKAVYSCNVINDAGSSLSTYTAIDVYAPPTFIKRLEPYYELPLNASEFKLACHVECYPKCSIYWLLNGIPIHRNNRFTITNVNHPEKPELNQFESVQSILTGHIATWPGGAKRNFNITCQSSNNDFGLGVSSTAYFVVGYPPENIEVLATTVMTSGGNIVPRFLTCSAAASPEATYTWKQGNVILLENSNKLNGNPTWKQGVVELECIAQNPLGKISTIFKINRATI